MGENVNLGEKESLMPVQLRVVFKTRSDYVMVYCLLARALFSVIKIDV